MSNRREQPDQPDDLQLEQLLKSSYADSAPSAGFKQALLRHLSREFKRLYLPNDATSSADQFPHDQLSGDQLSGDLLSADQLAGNHPAGNHPVSVPANASRQESGAAGVRSPDRPRRLVSLRLALSMAMAASLMLAVAIWNSQNAYGWTSMLRALDNCGWVQAVSETAGLSGWVSSQRGIVAIQVGDEIAFNDRQNQTTAQYLRTEQVVYEQQMFSSQVALSPAEQLFSLLLAGESNAEPGDQQRYRIVSESWQRVSAGIDGEKNDGEETDSEETIELRVTLLGSGSQRKSHKLLVVLDPSTQLPKSCQLLSSDKNSTKSIEFDYPANGPDSIFALGVPRETQVVRSLTALASTKSREARNAESARLAARAEATRAEDTMQRRLPTDQQPVARTAAKPAAQNGTKSTAKSEKTAAANQMADKATAKRDSPIALVEEAVSSRIVADEIVTVAPEEAASEQQPGEPRVAERIASNSPRQTRELPALEFTKDSLSPTDLVERINAQLSANWQAQGIQVAEPASDTEFLRRVYLDLTGRIPVPFEVYEYLEANPADRREKLVDQLLASRDHATHLATVWRRLLLPDGVDTNTYGGTGKFDEWLADRFAQNLPYDQLVSQLLLAEGRVSDSGPILFYAALKLNPEELAAKTSRTFLGMRMECAQCHDHPFDDSISQEDFWGFAAHFAQISRPMGKIEMTSSVLRVRDNDRGEVMLPDSDEVVPPHLPYEVSSAAEPNAAEQQDNDRSRRELLVDWLTTKQNSRFANAAVNRVWQHLFGLGLIEPADDMRSDNPAMCPEVLETLSHDFAANEYDLRRLLRALVLSDAYQLSSRATSDEPSQSLAFARMNIKSFTADQLYDCINVATEPDTSGAENAANGAALTRFGNSAREAFIEQFQVPPGQRTDYQAGIPQALTLMHGRLVHGATAMTTSGLLKSISAPFFSDEQRIETLFLSTLSRFPEKVEEEKMLAHLQAATSEEQRTNALGDILWALLNSAEFTFIH